jgi:hypothetical protein
MCLMFWRKARLAPREIGLVGVEQFGSRFAIFPKLGISPPCPGRGRVPSTSPTFKLTSYLKQSNSKITLASGFIEKG